VTKEIRIQRWPDIHAAMTALGGYGTSKQISERSGIDLKSITCFLGQYVSSGRVFRYGNGHLNKVYSLHPLDPAVFGARRERAERPAPGRDQVFAMVQEAGARGIEKAEIAERTGFLHDASDKHLCILRRLGKVWTVQYLRTARHFASQEHAQAFEATVPAIMAEARQRWQQRAVERKRELRAIASANRPPVVREPKPKKPKKREPRPGRELLARGTVNVERAVPTGPVIIPENVKRTVCPSPPERFSVQGPVIGGFATMGIGRYLESRP